MSRHHCIFFEEPIEDHFPGFQPAAKVAEFPIWGNFIVNDILGLSNVNAVPHTLFSVKELSALESVTRFLERGRGSDTLIVGRTGNVTVADWKEMCAQRFPDGISKIHLGRAPSELYVLRRKRFLRIVADIGKRMAHSDSGFCNLLFDDFFFYHFDRVIDMNGRNYLIRNASEYFRENLNLISYVHDRDFLELYGRLESPHENKMVIAESGTVRNSILGAGSRVKGLVEDSILFHDVFVARGAQVRNCVVLPSNIIEEGAVMEHALVLGGKDRVIERNVRIGGAKGVENLAYPAVMKNGLTVIGYGLTIPRESRIGTGCLVHGRSEKRLSEPLFVEDGDCYQAR